jgi:hypothetical protein
MRFAENAANAMQFIMRVVNVWLAERANLATPAKSYGAEVSHAGIPRRRDIARYMARRSFESDVPI